MMGYLTQLSFFSNSYHILPTSSLIGQLERRIVVRYLEAPYHKVQNEGYDGTEVHEVHGLLEEAPLPGWADEADQVLHDEEEDGTVLC